jgi:HK97 family phage major capsid protein
MQYKSLQHIKVLPRFAEICRKDRRNKTEMDVLQSGIYNKNKNGGNAKMKSKAMKNLLNAYAKAQGEAQTLIDKADATPAEIKAKQDEINAIKAKIALQEAADDGKKFDDAGEEIKDTDPVNPPVYAQAKDPAKKGPFNSFGEQMLAIVKSSRPGAAVDNRLLVVQNASGANEAVPSEGGFLVQQDFSSELIKNTFETGKLAKLCRRVGISANSNGIKLNGVDETSRASGSRWGGVQGYWANEAATVTAKKPKFRQIELTLNKMMALYYATDELMQDASAMNSVLSQAFPDELSFMLDDGIFRGPGAGQPLGIINSPALVSQAAETGQAADTVLFENVLNMWSRLIASSRANAVWLINQELEPQLYSMYLAIGTGGVPVYLPASGVAGSQYGTLFGRPVMPIEQASAPGDVGDIVLADMSKYLLADKGGMKVDSSIHVQFLYDELTFRVTYRVDGQPVMNSPITPYKGTASRTLSSFVTLAAR